MFFVVVGKSTKCQSQWQNIIHIKTRGLTEYKMGGNGFPMARMNDGDVGESWRDVHDW